MMFWTAGDKAFLTYLDNQPRLHDGVMETPDVSRIRLNRLENLLRNHTLSQKQRDFLWSLIRNPEWVKQAGGTEENGNDVRGLTYTFVETGVTSYPLTGPLRFETQAEFVELLTSLDLKDQIEYFGMFLRRNPHIPDAIWMESLDSEKDLDDLLRHPPLTPSRWNRVSENPQVFIRFARHNPYLTDSQYQEVKTFLEVRGEDTDYLLNKQDLQPEEAEALWKGNLRRTPEADWYAQNAPLTDSFFAAFLGSAVFDTPNSYLGHEFDPEVNLSDLCHNERLSVAQYEMLLEHAEERAKEYDYPLRVLSEQGNLSESQFTRLYGRVRRPDDANNFKGRLWENKHLPLSLFGNLLHYLNSWHSEMGPSPLKELGMNFNFGQDASGEHYLGIFNWVVMEVDAA